MSSYINADKLLAMTNDYKSGLGNLKTDSLVKSGVETVEGFAQNLMVIDNLIAEVEGQYERCNCRSNYIRFVNSSLGDYKDNKNEDRE